MEINANLMSKRSEILFDESFLWNDLKAVIENLSDYNQEVLPGIKWGCYSQLYTPAYWKVQYFLHTYKDKFSITYRLGENILEEVAACLLGGFGLNSEIGLAAFNRLRNRDQIQEGIDLLSISKSLMEPFFTVRGRKFHYRFPNQKAKFIFEFLNRNDLHQIPLQNDLALRHWLLSVNGIGPKTASWITRNFLDSEKVAIIDIHIFRAGLLSGIFLDVFDIQKDYFKLEQIFIQFCETLEVQPSKMDSIMWQQMKDSRRIALKTIQNH